MDEPKSDNENSIKKMNLFLLKTKGVKIVMQNLYEDWNINFEKESEFWTCLKKGFIYLPEIYTACNIGKYEIKRIKRKYFESILYQIK